MTVAIVVDTVARTATAGGETVRCAIGRAGVIAAAAKREGDGATPRGDWPARAVLLRPDRMAGPATALPWRWLRPADGWSDDPADAAYNRPVRHPHRYGAERLWRDDGVYDIIVVLGHNNAPPVAGFGSAIFMHCAAPDFAATEGCVAIDREVLARWLPLLRAGGVVRIV